MARSVAGGLLSGLGGGVVNRHENDREDAQIAREQAIERAREIRQDLMRREEVQGARADNIAADTANRVSRENESRADRESREGEVADSFIDENNQVHTVTRGGLIKGSGIKARPERTSGSAADPFPEQEWRAVVQRYTTKDPETGYDVTDWEGVADKFDQMGNAKLAELARNYGSGEDAPSDSPELDQFAARTEDIRAAAGGKSDPALDEYLDIADRATGRKSTPNAAPSRAPAATGGKPPGAGTQASPYQATTQEQIDWFKQNATAGAIIEVDGQLFSK
jgi:hypothetical protein